MSTVGGVIFYKNVGVVFESVVVGLVGKLQYIFIVYFLFFFAFFWVVEFLYFSFFQIN